MKTQINNETKARFFGLYLGSKVEYIHFEYVGVHLFDSRVQTGKLVGVTNYNDYEMLIDTESALYPASCPEKPCLLLAILEAITDEDAEVIARYRYSDPKALTYAHIGKCIIDSYLKSLKGDERITYQLAQLEPFEVDYLRSRGYLLPWNGLSTEEILAAGWVRYNQ
jgi:hypothetical protein